MRRFILGLAIGMILGDAGALYGCSGATTLRWARGFGITPWSYAA